MREKQHWKPSTVDERGRSSTVQLAVFEMGLSQGDLLFRCADTGHNSGQCRCYVASVGRVDLAASEEESRLHQERANPLSACHESLGPPLQCISVGCVSTASKSMGSRVEAKPPGLAALNAGSMHGLCMGPLQPRKKRLVEARVSLDDEK